VIRLTQADRRQSWCSWHRDMDINRKQALLLAADANATKNRLLRDAIRLHLGRLPIDKTIDALVTERREPGSPVVWVCWGDKAIAIRTDCTGKVKDCRYYLTWFWKTLPKEDN
jgi:hypothetical protein